MPKIAQILVAAGIGARAGGDIPKQYRLIAGKTILEHTVTAMMNSGKIDKTIVVIAKNDTHAPEILDGFDVEFTQGGASRTDSVKAGLDALIDYAPDYVLIHDAARPFVSNIIINDLISALNTHDAAVPVLPIADAIKSFEGDQIGKDVPRDDIRAVQTPQAFHFVKIYKAFDALAAGTSFSDDIAIAHAAGLSIAVVAGARKNVKLTYPEDFTRAEKDMSMNTQDSYVATGNGYDVHRYAEGDVLWLCGVPIKCGYTLLGHSDADVGLHALTDAILGAACAGDIGDHFPPSDPQWKGASSDKFLKFAADQVRQRGGKIEHIDVTLICEKPKIKPHREAMRKRLSEILDMLETRISVKATTTEKLGFTGRAEGMAAQATASVRFLNE